jgi:tetratricopeptide (TPR) repeat protein
MKTKEIAFTLPVCIAVYEFMFFRGKPVKRLLCLIPLLLTMLIIPLTLLNLNAPLGDIIGDVSEVTRDHPDIPRLSYLFTQFRVMVTYLRLLVLPISQNFDYDYPVYNALLDPAVFLSFMFVLLVLGLGVYLHRISGRAETNKKYWLRLTSFGIFWFFLALSVESSVIPINDIIVEHRLYLPSVGFFMAIAAGLGAGMAGWREGAAYAKKAVVYGMLAVMLVLSGAAYARNELWKDSMSLWGNAVEGSPNKARPHNSLGQAYFARGRIAEAIHEFSTAIRLNPYSAKAYNNLGFAYFAQGRIVEAIEQYGAALKLLPEDATAHNNLGMAYAAQGRAEESVLEFEAVVRLRPAGANAHFNLGKAYADQGRYAEAVREYKMTLRLNPEDEVVRKSLEALLKK